MSSRLTTPLQYQILHNLDSRFWRGYEPGDRLAYGFAGDIDSVPLDPEPAGRMPNLMELYQMLMATAEEVFVRHNADDRPDAMRFPSLSVGDVVSLRPRGQLGSLATLTVIVVGFSPVVVRDEDLLEQDWSPALYREGR